MKAAFGVNAACLEGISPFDFPSVPVLNGLQHPCDLPEGACNPLAGTLRFTPAKSDTLS